MKRLLDKVNEVYTNVPFYFKHKQEQNKSDEIFRSWEEVPVITKDDIIQDSHMMIAPRYFMQYENEEYTKLTTSGSCGKCMDIFWDYSEYWRSMVPLWNLRKKWYGISPEQRLCTFHTIANQKESEEEGLYFTEKENWLSISKLNLDTRKLDKIYNKIKDFEPDWMIMQPSMALLLGKFIVDNQYELIKTVKFIELTGEYISAINQENIKKMFGCNVANQYGTNEVNSIAYQCKCGNIHCIEENVYAEVLGKCGEAVENEEGEICVTSLQNNFMPFIRYKTGDRGIIKRINCNCGKNGKIIEVKNGRTSDLIKCKNGDTILPSCFDRAVHIINYLHKNIILQYQVTQDDYDKFTINLVLKKDKQVDIEEMQWLFVVHMEEEYVQNSGLCFQYPTELYPNERTGKLKMFESLVD